MRGWFVASKHEPFLDLTVLGTVICLDTCHLGCRLGHPGYVAFSTSTTLEITAGSRHDSHLRSTRKI